MNEPRWYCVNSFGVALLCCDKEGAEIEAVHMDRVDSKHAPHRAVQLVDAAKIQEGMTFLAKAIGRFTADPADAKLIMVEAVHRIDGQNAVIRELDFENKELKKLLSDIHADMLMRWQEFQKRDLSHSIWLRLKEAIK